MIGNRMLHHWKLKGIIQKVLSSMPGGVGINDALQRSVGDLKRFDQNIAGKVKDWAGIMSYLQAVNRNVVDGLSLLEVGSGWYPTLPMCFSLAGAKLVYTVDLTRHMSEPLTFQMLRALEQHLPLIAELSKQPGARVSEAYLRLSRTTSLDELLSAARIIYRAPQDAAALNGLADESLDMVFSNSVLEHVPGPVIDAVMRESQRVIKKDGLAVHAVACNDHYAHFDKSISFINFLKYPADRWQFWNNRLNYQNRLRAPDFIKLAKDNGFEIIHEGRAVRPGTREALATMTIAPEFRSYQTEDLIATTVDFVARKCK